MQSQEVHQSQTCSLIRVFSPFLAALLRDCWRMWQIEHRLRVNENLNLRFFFSEKSKFDFVNAWGIYQNLGLIFFPNKIIPKRINHLILPRHETSWVQHSWLEGPPSLYIFYAKLFIDLRLFSDKLTQLFRTGSFCNFLSDLADSSYNIPTVFFRSGQVF